MWGRRLWVTEPFGVSVQEFEVPDTPSEGQVLIQTERTLISSGTELAIVMGTHIGFTTGAAWPRYPMTLGYTAVGRVIGVGAGAHGVSEGTRVLVATPHASHAITDAADLLVIPEDVDADAALLAHLSWIPLCGVRLSRPEMGEGMAVFGQGLIGALAARFGRAAGCRPVLGVDPLPDRRQLAEKAGIIPIDPSTIPPADAHRRLADGRLPDIVIEATGVPAVITDALRIAADMGRVVLLGSPRGKVEIDPYTDIHRKGISVIGAHARATPRVATPDNPFTADRNRRFALTLVADGSLNVQGLISHHITPDAALDTYRALSQRAPGFMGVVINWS